MSRRLNVPGEGLDGVHFMYSHADCERILAQTRRGQQAVVIGGGLLGAELAEVWRHFGLQVTFLVREPWYFPKGLDEIQGRLIAEEMRRHGVDLRFDERVTELRGDGAVSSVVTQSGKEFPAQAVGATVGVEPNVELAQASGLEVARGVVVDTHLRTSREHFFAAGDCAEIRGGDSPLIEQLWYSAGRQGEAAARARCAATPVPTTRASSTTPPCSSAWTTWPSAPVTPAPGSARRPWFLARPVPHAGSSATRES